MNKSNTQQKKNSVVSYVYATLIGLLVVACAITIAMVNNGKKSNTGLNVGEDIPVAANTYVLPMKDAVVIKDYSGKELQYNDTLKQWEIHKAIDFQAGEDASVFAVCNGTVSNVYTNYLEGTVVEITHNNGMVTVYKSLDKDVKVSVGDKVSAGTLIGSASSTMAGELASGNHLHFEMVLNGTKVDPNNYLALGEK